MRHMLKRDPPLSKTGMRDTVLPDFRYLRHYPDGNQMDTGRWLEFSLHLGWSSESCRNCRRQYCYQAC